MIAETSRTTRWRTTTLRKLGQVCDQIARIKGGEDATLATVPLPGQGGDLPDDPLARLEWFKRLLNETLAALAYGTHGRCRSCGEPIPPPELDELPWADVCGRCV